MAPRPGFLAAQAIMLRAPTVHLPPGAELIHVVGFTPEDLLYSIKATAAMYPDIDLTACRWSYEELDSGSLSIAIMLKGPSQ